MITKLALSLLFAAIPTQAFAYLDPGSGSYLIQTLIAVLIGGLYTLKLYWGKVRSFLGFSNKKRETDKTDSPKN